MPKEPSTRSAPGTTSSSTRFLRRKQKTGASPRATFRISKPRPRTTTMSTPLSCASPSSRWSMSTIKTSTSIQLQNKAQKPENR
uniref:Uncharacterized protein n=1 Tax=Aegilops tauschii subsp. strangulata TaxID=200361 RepID=A0A452ZP23_AEGTS